MLLLAVMNEIINERISQVRNFPRLTFSKGDINAENKTIKFTVNSFHYISA